MAIVDKTHSQTIEEAFGKMGSGGGSFTEVALTILAVNRECTVMSYSEIGGGYGVRVENWCVLPEPSSIYGSDMRGCAINNEFEVKVTYVDGEGQENVDSVIVKFDADKPPFTTAVLSTSGKSMLYGDTSFGVIAVPQYVGSTDEYIRHDLFIAPRRATGDTTAHVEVGPVQLIRTTKEFDLATMLVNI